MRLLRLLTLLTVAVVMAIMGGMMSSCGGNSGNKCETCGSDIDKCAVGCTCKDCSSACSCKRIVTDDEHEKATSVDSMKVYIDASGSMIGYFDKGSGEGFITALTKLSNYGKGDNPVYFFGSDEKINVNPAKGTGLAGELKEKHKKGHSSFFYILFDRIADEIGNGDEDVICFVTDGIIGSSSKQTKEDPEYIKKNVNAVKNNISKVFKKHPDVKISVYKLSSTYVGAWYFDFQNIRKSSWKGVVERPFYVIAMGKADKLRQFRKDNGLEAQDEVHFGLHDTEWHNEKFRLTDLKRFNGVGKWIEGTGDQDCDLVMTLPICMHSNDAFYKENTVLKLDKGGGNVKEIGNNVISISNGVVHIKYNVGNNPEIVPGNKYTFRFSINSPRDSKWDGYSCDDDKDIDKDSLKQMQTFYLKYLLDGIYEGVGETVLMDIPFEFER